MISYCIVCYRPTYTRLLIDELVKKTSVRYEILVWLNTGDQHFYKWILKKQAQKVPIKIVGFTPHNVGMVAFKSLFARAKYDLITQLDDDVLCISPSIAQTAKAIFERNPAVWQLVADVWRDEYTHGNRPDMRHYRPYNKKDGLYDGPIDGWFSIYRRSILPVLLKAPYQRYFFLGSWVRSVLPKHGGIGVLCTKFKVFHCVGPIYAGHFGMLDFEARKLMEVGRHDAAVYYENKKTKIPPREVMDRCVGKIREHIDKFGS